MRSIRLLLAVALALTACVEENKHKDRTAPTVTAFTIPATAVSAEIPITTLTATDNVGVTGYLVTESATVPLDDDPRWTATAPASHTVAADGTFTFRAWAKDAAGNVSPPLTATIRRVSRVSVLFTTDEHSHLFGFSPEVDDFPTPSSSGTGAIVGGMARVAAVLQAERSDASARSADTITVSAGDFSQGTLASAAFLALSPELVLMKEMGYDAVAIGNHEFDLGPTALADAIYTAVGAGGLPPLVLTNAYFDPERTGDDALATLYGPGNAIAPSRIVQTPSGFRIGAVGVMGLGAAIDAAAASPLAFWDPTATTPAAQFGSIVATVQRAVTALRADAVDAVIVLGHGGIGATSAQQGDDELLAASVTGIDLLVSGHTHFFTPAPISVQDPEGHMVPVVQPKPYTEEVGRVELVFDGGSARPSLDPARTRFIAVDDRTAPTTDPQILAVLGNVKGYLEVGPGAPASFLERALSYVEGTDVVDDPDVLGDLYFRVLGHTSVDVTGLGFGETNGLNLDTDAMLAAARSVHAAHPTVAAIQARGSIRSDLRAGMTGDITFADVFDVVSLGADPTVSVPADPAEAAAVLPKIPGYPLVRFSLWTLELRAALEVGLLQSTRDPDFFVGPSGLVVDYDMTRTAFDPGAPLGPGWIKRLAVVDDAGVETQTLYDVTQAGWNGSHFVADPFALQAIVATYYVASFAQLAGVTLKDDEGAPLSSVAAGILRRGDGSAVKDHEALARYIRDQCRSNGGELPARYGDAVPRRMRVPEL
ncbi:MAG TPA: 5'-nucleotidase C-terminal domain-containing protein [Anaeromyxobacter sp.]